jgi:hypothetical protein
LILSPKRGNRDGSVSHCWIAEVAAFIPTPATRIAAGSTLISKIAALIVAVARVIATVLALISDCADVIVRLEAVISKVSAFVSKVTDVISWPDETISFLVELVSNRNACISPQGHAQELMKWPACIVDGFPDPKLPQRVSPISDAFNSG